MFRRPAPLAAVVFCLLSLGMLANACSSEDELLLGAGTTVHDSGLLDVLVAAFEEESGYKVSAVPAGTGQLLEMGRRGDADVLLTHDPSGEQQFMAEGYGINRQPVMHNDFIVVGPADDPAGVVAAEDAATALHAVAKSEVPFVSRGDQSGTHKLELRLWQQNSYDPAGQSWYSESGQGMGATLQIANQRNAYTITDRGTFLALADTLDLVIVFEGDPELLNVYHVLQVNPEKHAAVRSAQAAAFVQFITSAAAQQLIRDFGVAEYGEPLFIPDALVNESESR